MLNLMWKGLAGSDRFLVKLARLLLLCAGLFWGVLFISLPLTWRDQTLLGIVMVGSGILIGRASRSALVTIALMVLSLFATVRYAWWRIGAVLTFFNDPSNKWDWIDAVCIVVLLSAESYAFIILFLGFMQTIWPLKRPIVPLPENSEDWPRVDLLIPSYNEPLNIVRSTALAAMNVDWPADKLNIYILDDGRREAFREFAEDAGVGYITRDNNRHAKAGNINQALEKLDAPYVAIFDCDHLPTRSFLQVTMGWFLREEKLAMVQTPHHFYSADPFERNLKQFRMIPNEGELFYGVVQDGNDFWNATFFCGSCAVLRRTALDEIGGIAVETVTEDAHTSLRMQMRGWNTAYINIPQAAGLATERLSGHIQQRVRWARGMIQILRTDNPLFAKGLKFAQRICYFNAMTHFLYAVPRLIFLTAPLVYLFFSRSNVPGFWAAILAYALPHLVLSNVTNSRIQGEHRHSFWNEIYETVLAPYILLPTLTALINPKLGTFNVTAKGGFVQETYFDRRIATPFILLLLLNVSGLLMVIPRLVHVPGMEHFFDATHPGTVAMNALWCLFNVTILGVAITVAREEIQRREQVRIDFVLPFRMKLGDGTIVTGQTIDVSLGGVALDVAGTFPFAAGEWVTLLLPMRVGDAELPATIIDRRGNMMRLQFESLSMLEEEMLTTILYSRADAWVGWAGTREPDKPLRSLYRIMRLSVSGLWSIISTPFHRKKPPAPRPPVASRVAPILLCALALGAACHTTHAQSVHHAKVAAPAAADATAFTSQLSLKDLGESGLIQLHGIDNFRSVSFVLPASQIIETAALHLVYRFSPQAAASGRLKVLLNGTAFATLQPPAGLHEAEFSQTIPVPAELLVRQNQLTFEFLGREGARCEDASTEALTANIDPASSLQMKGQRLPLANDLHQLPLPWLDTEILRQQSIPIVLSGTPSPMALQAAGVVASYFGMAAEYPIPRFPVSLGTIPRGDVVLVAESSSGLLENLDVGPVVAPLVAIRANPNDPLGKVMIVTGADGEQLLSAAQALALQWPGLQGTSTEVQGLELPPPRLADDAPRWARIEDHAPLWGANEGTTRESDGAGPVQIFLRVPPDLSYADRNNLNLHLEYRYNTAAVGAGSALLIRVNGAPIGSILLKPNKGSMTTETKVDLPLPVVNLRPFSNSITAQWAIRQPHATHCSATDVPASSGSNFTGSILGTSYLGLSGLSHWAKLPNLELFSNAGFPFTRFADLSQTTVVLADQPSAQEIELYLTLLAHFSAQTGYPALRVTLGNATQMVPGVDRDFLVIGTGQDNPAVFQAGDRMPVLIDGDQLVVRQPATVAEHLRQAWTNFMEHVGDAPRRLGFEAAPDPFPTEVPGTLMEGLESPYSTDRTLMVIELKDASTFEPFIATFLNSTHSSDISGDVSVLNGPRFHSFRIGDSSYFLGSRPWLTRLRVSMIHGPWFLVLGLLIFSLLSAARIQARLRHMSVVRLHLGEELV
jgi:cellulose synthase (UDP-forming)